MGTIKWISQGHSHPGEHSRRHEYAFRKGEAVQQAIVQNVEMRGQLEIGLVNVADRSSRAPPDQWASPTRIPIAQGCCAVGMNVCGDRARYELKPRLIERASDVSGIPSIIKSAVAHRKSIGKDRRQIIEHHWHTLLMTLIHNRPHPGVADF